MRVARCGPRPLPDAAFFQIAEHCNRAQFSALIGTSYSGIVISDRWNGYAHLDPNRRQVCWSHLQRDFRRHADGLASRRPRRTRRPAHQPGVRRLARLPARAPRPRPTPGRDRPDPDRAPSAARRRQPEEPTNALAPPVRQQPAQGLARALDLRHHRRRPADQQPRRTRAPLPGHPPKTLARHPKPDTANDSPNAPSPPPSPAACNTARRSPTSAN